MKNFRVTICARAPESRLHVHKQVFTAAALAQEADKRAWSDLERLDYIPLVVIETKEIT